MRDVLEGGMIALDPLDSVEKNIANLGIDGGYRRQNRTRITYGEGALFHTKYVKET